MVSRLTVFRVFHLFRKTLEKAPLFIPVFRFPTTLYRVLENETENGGGAAGKPKGYFPEFPQARFGMSGKSAVVYPASAAYSAPTEFARLAA